MGRAAFSLDDRAVRRAGLDYWPHVMLDMVPDLDAIKTARPETRFLYLTTKASRSYSDWKYGQDDCLVFGPETRGLPENLLAANADHCLTIPMLNPAVRSLNLANAVSIVLYEALRQLKAFEDLPSR